MLIQRGISARTKDITQYLLKSPHRFLGGLVVAAVHHPLPLPAEQLLTLAL